MHFFWSTHRQANTLWKELSWLSRGSVYKYYTLKYIHMYAYIYRSIVCLTYYTGINITEQHTVHTFLRTHKYCMLYEMWDAMKALEKHNKLCTISPKCWQNNSALASKRNTLCTVQSVLSWHLNNKDAAESVCVFLIYLKSGSALILV